MSAEPNTARSRWDLELAVEAEGRDWLRRREPNHLAAQNCPAALPLPVPAPAQLLRLSYGQATPFHPALATLGSVSHTWRTYGVPMGYIRTPNWAILAHPGAPFPPSLSSVRLITVVAGIGA